jgi:DNA/RNA endonuclease YhcR with UshA esterase domain
MKSFLFTLLVLVSLSSLTLADTYTGVVSEVKQFHSGGTAVDMDGAYPNQKMVLYVSAADTKVTKMPAVGDKVTATGEITQYKGKPEIKIHSDDQWKW